MGKLPFLKNSGNSGVFYVLFSGEDSTRCGWVANSDILNVARFSVVLMVKTMKCSRYPGLYKFTSASFHELVPHKAATEYIHSSRNPSMSTFYVVSAISRWSFFTLHKDHAQSGTAVSNSVSDVLRISTSVILGVATHHVHTIRTDTRHRMIIRPLVY